MVKMGEKIRYHKEHLTSVFVGQEEQTEDMSEWNLVVKALAVKLQERWVQSHVVTTTTNKTLSIYNMRMFKGQRQSSY